MSCANVRRGLSLRWLHHQGATVEDCARGLVGVRGPLAGRPHHLTQEHRSAEEYCSSLDQRGSAALIVVKIPLLAFVYFATAWTLQRRSLEVMP